MVHDVKATLTLSYSPLPNVNLAERFKRPKQTILTRTFRMPLMPSTGMNVGFEKKKNDPGPSFSEEYRAIQKEAKEQSKDHQDELDFPIIQDGLFAICGEPRLTVLIDGSSRWDIILQHTQGPIEKIGHPLIHEVIVDQLVTLYGFIDETEEESDHYR